MIWTHSRVHSLRRLVRRRSLEIKGANQPMWPNRQLKMVRINVRLEWARIVCNNRINACNNMDLRVCKINSLDSKDRDGLSNMAILVKATIGVNLVHRRRKSKNSIQEVKCRLIRVGVSSKVHLNRDRLVGDNSMNNKRGRSSPKRNQNNRH